MRPLRLDHLEATFAWRTHPAVRDWFAGPPPSTFAEHVEWWRSHQDQTDQTFAVEVNGRHVAQVAVYHIDWGTDSAEVGRLLVDPSQWGRGYGRRAWHMGLAHADLLGLRSLRLSVRSDNEPALAIYGKSGFREVYRVTSPTHQMIQMTTER